MIFEYQYQYQFTSINRVNNNGREKHERNWIGLDWIGLTQRKLFWLVLLSLITFMLCRWLRLFWDFCVQLRCDATICMDGRSNCAKSPEIEGDCSEMIRCREKGTRKYSNTSDWYLAHFGVLGVTAMKMKMGRFGEWFCVEIV